MRPAARKADTGPGIDAGAIVLLRHRTLNAYLAGRFRPKSSV
jgi:hypothetical protein